MLNSLKQVQLGRGFLGLVKWKTLKDEESLVGTILGRKKSSHLICTIWFVFCHELMWESC